VVLKIVKELGVAYFGNLFPDRAKEDMKEMIDHGCNSILIAMSEYDWIQWRTNIFKICQIAKDLGFTVYMNLWAWGSVFGGEAPSFFLHNNVDYRQIISTNGKKVAAACFNTIEFKNYIYNAIKILAEKDFIDGFLWDEPHYYYTRPNVDFYTCRCKTCQELFTGIYKKEIPITKTNEVIEFKENTIINFIKHISKKVKEIDPKKKVSLCLVPPPLETGISDWDKCCEKLKDVIDVISCTPYWLLYRKSLNYVKKYTEKTVMLAKKYNLESLLWCLAFLVPRKKEYQLKEAIDIFDRYNVDSIFAWSYRGSEGLLHASHNPKEVWSLIGEAYNNLRRKYNI